VIDSFREVQAAEQERDRLQKEADAYANRVLAGARGEAAQVLEQAEGYRAQVVNEARVRRAASSRWLQEYVKAPEVTRRRLYLETMERTLGDMNKVILDGVSANGAGRPALPAAERSWPAVAPAPQRRQEGTN
jgi:modulator of FtsH protease HflK